MTRNEQLNQHLMQLLNDLHEAQIESQELRIIREYNKYFWEHRN